MRRARQLARPPRSHAEETGSVSPEMAGAGYRKTYHAFFRSRAMLRPRSPHRRSHNFLPHQRAKSFSAKPVALSRFEFQGRELQARSTGAAKRQNVER